MQLNEMTGRYGRLGGRGSCRVKRRKSHEIQARLRRSVALPIAIQFRFDAYKPRLKVGKLHGRLGRLVAIVASIRFENSQSSPTAFTAFSPTNIAKAPFILIKLIVTQIPPIVAATVVTSEMQLNKAV